MPMVFGNKEIYFYKYNDPAVLAARFFALLTTSTLLYCGLKLYQMLWILAELAFMCFYHLHAFPLLFEPLF